MQDFTKDIIWKAVYNDGSELWEEGKGKPHTFDEIDQTKLKEFHLMKPSNNLDDYEKEESIFVTTTTRGEKVEVRSRILHKEIPPVFKVILDGQKRLIWFRRPRVTRGQHVIDMGSKLGKFPLPVAINNKLLLVGWQETINGKNIQAINCIHPDGRIELMGAWGTDADHKAPETALDPVKKSVNT